MKQIQWPAALVVTVAIIALVLMAKWDVDTSDVMWVILAVLGGMGFTQLSAVREQTNGNTSEVLRQLREQQAEQARLIREMAANLAAAPPAPPQPQPKPDEVHTTTYTYP